MPAAPPREREEDAFAARAARRAQAGAWLPEALRRALGRELLAALERDEDVRMVTPAATWASPQALLALTNGGLATIVGTLGAGRIVDRWGTAVLYKVSGSMAFLSAAGFLTLLVLMHMRHRWEGEANG
jgi:hypothetical protein